MTRSVERRVAKLETRHGIGARTYVIAKDAREPYDQAVALAGIEPADDDTVIITNYYFGGDGIDRPDRRLLFVW